MSVAVNTRIPNRVKNHIKLLEAALDNVSAYIFTKDLEGRYTYVNQAVLKLFDKTFEEVVGFDDSHFFDLKISNQIRENDREVMRTKQAVAAEEANFVKATDELRIYRSSKEPLFDDDGNVIGICGISTDITHEKQLQKTIADQKHMLDAVLNNIDAHVYMKSSDRRFLFVNQRVAELFGLTAEQIIGKKDTDILPQNVADHFWMTDKKVFETSEKQSVEEVVQDKDGSLLRYLSVKIPYMHNGDELTPALIGFSTDITELFQLKEEFKRQARTDALTGLYNRRYFFEQAEKEFNRATRHDEDIALISIDIDHFKDVNDKFGHPTGDAVLQCIAANLQQMIRVEDTLARMGGEEFSILLPKTSKIHAKAMAERICQYHSEFPCKGLGDDTHRVTLSVGVTSLLEQDNNFDNIFSRADRALYRAKQSGRNQVFLDLSTTE